VSYFCSWRHSLMNHSECLEEGRQAQGKDCLGERKGIQWRLYPAGAKRSLSGR